MTLEEKIQGIHTRDEIVSLEERVQSLSAEILRARANVEQIDTHDRDYAGTLWVNLLTLQKTADVLATALSKRFALK